MRILVRPIITEKSMQQVADGKYTFEVAPDVNKHQIAQNVEQMYKVEVLDVNIIKVRSIEKIIRGRSKGTDYGYKKAIVKIKKGQKIEGFEVKE